MLKGNVSTCIPRIEMATTDDGMLRIAGDEQHLEIGSQHPRCASATWRPFVPPGRPTSVTSRSTRPLPCETLSPNARSSASIAA